MANQESVSYVVGDVGSSYPDALTPDTTYYWRVDEINDVNYAENLDPNNILKGEVWSFTIPGEKAWNVPAPTDRESSHSHRQHTHGHGQDQSIFCEFF